MILMFLLEIGIKKCCRIQVKNKVQVQSFYSAIFTVDSIANTVTRLKDS